MKVQIISSKVSPFSGFSYVNNELKLIVGNMVSGTNTFLRLIEELATVNTKYVSQSGIFYYFNNNNTFNYIN